MALLFSCCAINIVSPVQGLRSLPLEIPPTFDTCHRVRLLPSG